MEMRRVVGQLTLRPSVPQLDRTIRTALHRGLEMWTGRFPYTTVIADLLRAAGSDLHALRAAVQRHHISERFLYRRPPPGWREGDILPRWAYLMPDAYLAGGELYQANAEAGAEPDEDAHRQNGHW